MIAAKQIGLFSYLYKKAINAAYAAGTLTGGVEAMIAFCAQTNGSGSNAMQAATTNILCPPGGDFETLVLSPWLAGSTSASPAGQGLSSSTSPTLAATIAALRSSALQQTG